MPYLPSSDREGKGGKRVGQAFIVPQCSPSRTAAVPAAALLPRKGLNITHRREVNIDFSFCLYEHKLLLFLVFALENCLILTY